MSVSQSDGGVPFVGPLPATATGALGAATWDSFVGVVSNRSGLGVWGDVQRGDGKPADGYGTAIAKDPFVFDFTTPGTLDFTFVAGGSWPLSPPPLEPFGPRPSSTFSLFSDSAGGHAHVDFSAGLTGVSLGGTPLDGELFLLSVSATGVLLSPAELEIGFRPWAGLGLTDTDVDTFIAYVRSKLAVLPDGSVGLAPGAEFALVGPGSPIPTLTFSFAAGRVTTSSAAAAEALTVPEPTLALLLVPAGLAAIARRRRTSLPRRYRRRLVATRSV